MCGEGERRSSALPHGHTPPETPRRRPGPAGAWGRGGLTGAGVKRSVPWSRERPCSRRLRPPCVGASRQSPPPLPSQTPRGPRRRPREQARGRRRRSPLLQEAQGRRRGSPPAPRPGRRRGPGSTRTPPPSTSQVGRGRARFRKGGCPAHGTAPSPPHLLSAAAASLGSLSPVLCPGSVQPGKKVHLPGGTRLSVLTRFAGNPSHVRLLSVQRTGRAASATWARGLQDRGAGGRGSRNRLPLRGPVWLFPASERLACSPLQRACFAGRDSLEALRWEPHSPEFLPLSEKRAPAGPQP